MCTTRGCKQRQSACLHDVVQESVEQTHQYRKMLACNLNIVALCSQATPSVHPHLSCKQQVQHQECFCACGKLCIQGAGCTMLDAVWPSIVMSLLVFPGREKMIAGVMPCCTDSAGVVRKV